MSKIYYYPQRPQVRPQGRRLSSTMTERSKIQEHLIDTKPVSEACPFWPNIEKRYILVSSGRLYSSGLRGSFFRNVSCRDISHPRLLPALGERLARFTLCHLFSHAPRFLTFCSPLPAFPFLFSFRFFSLTILLLLSPPSFHFTSQPLLGASAY